MNSRFLLLLTIGTWGCGNTPNSTPHIAGPASVEAPPMSAETAKVSAGAQNQPVMGA
jgi:hypothetical protein